MTECSWPRLESMTLLAEAFADARDLGTCKPGTANVIRESPKVSKRASVLQTTTAVGKPADDAMFPGRVELWFCLPTAHMPIRRSGS
jgi:hypothetical protein